MGRPKKEVKAEVMKEYEPLKPVEVKEENPNVVISKKIDISEK